MSCSAHTLHGGGAQALAWQAAAQWPSNGLPGDQCCRPCRTALRLRSEGLPDGLLECGRHQSFTATDMLCFDCRYFMVGGSDAGMVGSRSVAASGASGSLKASLRGGPFGPGGLGFDPTLGEDAGSMPPIAGETSFNRSGQDPNAQQSGVSQVGRTVASVPHTKLL